MIDVYIDSLETKKKFTIDISGRVELSLEDLWPDDDPPNNPTAEDVAKLIENYVDISDFISDWNLGDSLTVSVS